MDFETRLQIFGKFGNCVTTWTICLILLASWRLVVKITITTTRKVCNLFVCRKRCRITYFVRSPSKSFHLEHFANFFAHQVEILYLLQLQRTISIVFALRVIIVPIVHDKSYDEVVAQNTKFCLLYRITRADSQYVRNGVIRQSCTIFGVDEGWIIVGNPFFKLFRDGNDFRRDFQNISQVGSTAGKLMSM